MIDYLLQEIKEISNSTFRYYVLSFDHRSKEPESDSGNSDSDLSDFDSDLFGCGEITPEVETLVENTWEICSPLDEVYGTTASSIMKEVIGTAKEETECTGLIFFKYLTPGEDQNLIAACTEVCFWCCCETIKKVSPIIAEATIQLLI